MMRPGMALDYTPEHGRRRLVLVAHEDFAVQDILDMIDRRVRDGTWQYSVLLDLRRRVRPLSRGDILLVVARVNELARTAGQPGPMAIVVGDLVGFGMGRMYSLYGENAGRTIEVFREVRAAEGWLDGGDEPPPVEETDAPPACQPTDTAVIRERS